MTTTQLAIQVAMAAYNLSVDETEESGVAGGNGTAQEDDDISRAWTSADTKLVMGLYVLVAILGTIGNILVLVVYFGRRSLREHTTNIFIINLALCDLTTSVLIIPFKVITYPVPGGVMGEILCRCFISQYFLWSSGGASAYTLFWVTIERHYAIIHPMKYDRLFTPRRAVWMCASAWILAVLLETYEPFSFRVTSGHICEFSATHVTRVLICTEGACILGINVVMLTVYSRIAWALSSNMSNLKKQGIPLTDPRQYETVIAKRRLAKMMFIVLGAYFTCWVSVGICNIWTVVWPDVYGTWGGMIAMLLASANSCMNPIIYCFQSRMFRRNLKRMFCRKLAHENSQVSL